MAKQCSHLPSVEPQSATGRPSVSSTYVRRMLCSLAFLAFFGVGDFSVFRGLYAHASTTAAVREASHARAGNRVSNLRSTRLRAGRPHGNDSGSLCRNQPGCNPRTD